MRHRKTVIVFATISASLALIFVIRSYAACVSQRDTAAKLSECYLDGVLINYDVPRPKWLWRNGSYVSSRGDSDPHPLTFHFWHSVTSVTIWAKPQQLHIPSDVILALDKRRSIKVTLIGEFDNSAVDEISKLMVDDIKVVIFDSDTDSLTPLERLVSSRQKLGKKTSISRTDYEPYWHFQY